MSFVNAHNTSVSDISPEMKLRRATLACMLWENNAYSSGMSVVQDIVNLVPLVAPEKVQQIAIEARTKQKLRHVPLILVSAMATLPAYKHLVADTIKQVCLRPDELGELLSLYWREGKSSIPNQMKKGFREALTGYNAYQIARYQGISGSKSISLRDILFLSHAKPKDEAQADLFKQLASKTLASPETWETALSANAGGDKKEVWTRLLEEKKIGSLALIRNLRNMTQAAVEPELIRKALSSAKTDMVLPFQFLSAATEAPEYKPELETLMLKSVSGFSKLHGKTVVVVDVSGSMMTGLSSKSKLTRLDTAIALAILLQGVSESCEVFVTAGSDGSRRGRSEKLPDDIRGLALFDAIKKAYSRLGGGGIFLKHAIDYASANTSSVPTETLVVISDSQDTSGDDSPRRVVPFAKRNYMMDISVEKAGVAYEKLTVLNGFSESLVNYLIEEQKMFDEIESISEPPSL
jgi:hypothetical protein